MKLNIAPYEARPGHAVTTEIEIGHEDVNASGLTGLTLPANSLVKFRALGREVFNSGGGDDAVTLGVLGNTDAYVAAANYDPTKTDVEDEVAYFVATATPVYYEHVSTGAVPTTGRVKMAVEITRMSE